MSNTSMDGGPIPPLVGLGGDDAPDPAEVATTEVDGEVVLDPDADDELIDSADADRIAADGD
jgi:hypothetical protein